MKFLYLIPPSEWKSLTWSFKNEKLSYNFEKPIFIMKNLSEKDIKCKWERFLEAIKLNNLLISWNSLNYDLAIKRYNWVMYKSINYDWMNLNQKDYFDNNFLILSWMYWLLKPNDFIWNYKLPIEAKWLTIYRKMLINDFLNTFQVDYIVNFLPISYSKILDFKKLTKKIINVNFLHEKKWKIVKISHWVKSIKWDYINRLCNLNWFDISDIENVKDNIYEKNIFIK